jgi:hypothetical protein
MPGGPSQRPEDVRFISGVILVSRQAERVAGRPTQDLGPLANQSVRGQRYHPAA